MHSGTRVSNQKCCEPSIWTSSPTRARRLRGWCTEGSRRRRSSHKPSAIIHWRRLSRETRQPCRWLSFSQASVGPKSAYRSLTIATASSRTAAGSRLVLGRPRRLDTKLTAPRSRKPRSKRNTCRRCSPSRVQASAVLMRPASRLRSTSSRATSLSLIDTTAIRPVLPQPQHARGCRLSFAQGCHLYIAPTRDAAMEDLREKRQPLQAFLLRHGRIYPGLRPWTQVHARWLSNLSFAHPAQYLVLREYRQAIEDAEARLERLTQQVSEVVSSWSMAPVVEAYQAMRGVAFLTAVTFVAEIGDVRRFETPRQLMAYVGLVPSERSTGEQVRRGSITKAGNPRARRVLIEGAWTYRYPARLSRPLQVRQESLPQVVRAIAWKAQLRLCARYRRLTAAGKRQTLVTTAIAREMAAFLWAIGHAVEPRSA